MSSIVYITLIAGALASAIFGAVTQSGANIMRLDRRMTAVSLISGASQLLAVLAGCGAGAWILRGAVARERSIFWVHVLSGVLLSAAGIRMLTAALRERKLSEHRVERIDIRSDALLVLRLSVISLLSGVACGLMQFRLTAVLPLFFAASAVSAAGGYVSGRAYGPEGSRKGFAISGGLLCLTGIFLQVIG